MPDSLSSQLVEWTRKPWVRRAAIATYALILLGLTGVYIGISRLQVQTSIYLKGQSTLSTAHANPVRGIALHAPTGRQRTDMRLHLSLVPRPATDTSEDGAGDSVASLPETGRRSKAHHAEALEKAIAEGRASARWSIRPQPDGLIERELQLPDSTNPGPHWLYLRLEAPTVDSFVARRAVEVVEQRFSDIDPVPKRTFRVDRERRSDVRAGSVSEQSGPIAVDLVPPDGVVARGLKSSVFVRTYDKETGEPIPSRISFTDITARAGEAAGRPPSYDDLETGRFGLASLQIDPVGDQSWDVEVTPLDQSNFSKADSTTGSPDDGKRKPSGLSTATLDLTTVPSQTSMQIDSGVLHAGPDTSQSSRTLEGETASLFQSGRMFGDLYRGDVWIGASTSRIDNYFARLSWHIPAVRQSRLFRVQAHRDLYVPASAWDTGYVAALTDRRPQTLGAMLEKVYSHANEDDIASKGPSGAYNAYIIEHADAWTSSEGRQPARDQLIRLLNAGLETLPRHFESAPPLFNTQKGDREALETWIAEAQSDLLIFTALALLIALLGIATVVVIEVRKRRRHADEMRAVDAELEEVEVAGSESDGDALDAPVVELPAAGSPWLENLLTAVILLTFALFAVGLILVLSYM